MKRKMTIAFALAGLLLASCASIGPSSSAPSSTPSSPSSSSEPSSSSSSIAPVVHTVSFYVGEELVLTKTAEEGKMVDAPEEPKEEGYYFDGWYADPGFAEKYDFSTPIDGDISLYAKFVEIDYFALFNAEYIPSYSPLKTEQVLTVGEKDATLVMTCSEIGLKKGISTKMVRLAGAFEGLEATSVSLSEGTLTIQTEGTVGDGEGHVSLAKESNEAEAFLTATFPTIVRKAEVDASTYRLADENKKLDFTVALENMALLNEGNLSKDDYKAKVNSNEFPYFSVTPADRYSLELIEIADDWKSFRFRLTMPSAISLEVAQDILDNVRISAAGEAFDYAIPQEWTIDLLHAKTESSVAIYRTSPTEYGGSAKVKLQSCRITSAFANNLEKLTQEPKNQNLIITFPDVSTSITSLKKIDETTFEAKFKINAASLPEGKATIYLDQVQVDDEDPAKTNYIAKDWYAGHGITPEREYVEYVVDQSADAGGGTGTVTQTATESYRIVKSEVNEYAFSGQGNETSNDADGIISAATGIGKIGYGLYSGDFTTAKSGAGTLLGINSLIEPSTQILGSLASISQKLLEIEAKIDSIISSLDTIQVELEQLGQQSLLNNFLNANSAWKAFVTDYYIPLKDAVVSYSNDYFRYYYNLVIDAYEPYEGEEPQITLCYDREGNLVFPGRNMSLSIDGKIIDKNATKTVTIPTLNYALQGIFDNAGHVYSGIEDDIIADLFSYGQFSEDEVRDIAKSLRYQAMKSHFSEDADIDRFTLTFTNFCAAFTSTEFGSSLQSAITPLDSYRIMLETIYNFGFEIEPEFNLVLIKIESTYFCARSILGLVKFINSGEITSSRYDTLDKAVKAEFSDERFYHSSIDPKTIYSYVTASYITYKIEAYGVVTAVDYDYDDGIDTDTYVTRADEFDIQNHKKPDDVVSIDEAAIRLMGIKVKLYNNLKGTAYRLNEYLCQIGIIPQDKLEKTLGIIVSIDGVKNKDDDVGDLHYPSGWSIDEDRDETHAFKGKAYSFADGDFVNGLCAITCDWLATPLGSLVGITEVTNVGYVETYGYDFAAWAYYLNFLPANVG